jgi:hypothetical protein
MVNSREIVKLINKQMTETKNADVKKALQKLINSIEVLEDTELSEMYTEYEREKESKAARIKKIEEELAAMFN